MSIARLLDLMRIRPTPPSTRPASDSPPERDTSAPCPPGLEWPGATRPTSRRTPGDAQPPRESRVQSPRHSSTARSRARSTSQSYRRLPVLSPRGWSPNQRGQRGQLRGPDRGRPLAGNRDTVGDEQEPARPALVPVGAWPAHRALEIADDEPDPYAPDPSVVRRNHLDERLAERGDRLADLERRRPTVGGRDQDVLGDPAVRLQHQRPPEQRLDAEPRRRHRVVPGLKPVELARRRKGRRSAERAPAGVPARLKLSRQVALVGRVALSDGGELRATRGVGLVPAWPVAHHGGGRSEGLPLQHHEAPAEAGRPELVGRGAGRAPGRSTQAHELLGQRHQRVAEQQRDAAVGSFVNGHQVGTFLAHGGIAVEPHEISLHDQDYLPLAPRWTGTMTGA